jgi:hypothetical protein
MGFDKLINFFIKNLNHDTIEDININLNVRKIMINHIMFDISFMIYNNLTEIEDEINNIIKIILALPFNFSNNIIYEKIKNILKLDHWKWLNINFDGLNEETIINTFINYITNTQIDNYIIINKIIIIKIFNKINEYIKNIHNIELLQTINIIFDGIPSYSKILEQRRRRMKNYLESQERKNKFDNFFDIHNTFQEYDNLKYDYFKWIKLRFSIDKSFGPTSVLIINLEKYLFDNLKIQFPNCEIYINEGNINGEADYKIFKTIYEKKYIGDISIHTIDSDLVHQILVQQNYFNIINKDINLSVIRYNLKNNHLQYIDAKTIINNINKVYKEILHCDNNNKFIIYDLCLIFYFFGNDHLPSSNEIGPELSLEYFLKIHFKIFKNISNIITISNNQLNFSFINFKLYIQEILKDNEINKTKIILGKYFKIKPIITSFLTDKLILNFDKIILLSKKILFDDGKKNNDLDDDDLRFKLINKYTTIDYPFDINSIKNITKDECFNIFDKLLDILDILDTEEQFSGLPLYIKPFYLIENNNYQNLYASFTENIIYDLEKKNPLIYDYYDINHILKKTKIIKTNNDDNIKLYLKKIYHLVITLFGNMTDYNCNNFTYYKYYDTPSLESICYYLHNNFDNEIKNNFDTEIKDETVLAENYFNSINHHIIITPYIKDIIWKFNSPDLIFIINNLNIDNLWFNHTENFDYKNFNINIFFTQWFNTVIKLKLEQSKNIDFNNFNLLL